MNPLVIPARDAFVRTLEDIRANSNNPKIVDATYQLEVLSAAFWPDDEKTGTAARDRWIDYDLTGLECRMADLLHSRMGKTISKTSFLNYCYFDRSSEPESKIIDVKICHIRKKLKASPYVIENTWGEGYRMELKPT